MKTSSPAAEPAATTPSSSTRTPAEASKELLHTLFIELFQTERSADVHSLREAERLDGTPPALALRAVSTHAQSAMKEIVELAKKRNFEDTQAGVGIGEMFSQVRDHLADRLIDRERSYRGTLLGMRHGLDLVRSLGFAAGAAGDSELATFCETWQKARTPLVESAAAELAWFARNPERALEGGKGSWRGAIAAMLGIG